MIHDRGVRRVRVNDRGLAIGQDHHRAVLTDHEVEVIRQLHGEGLGYGAIARKFGVSKSHVRNIVLFRKRAETCVGHRLLFEGGRP